MIETRESYQPLLKHNSPPQSPGKRKKKRSPKAATSYGTLKGEALLHNDNDSSGAAAAAAASTPQSVEPSPYAEYQQPLNTIPLQQANNNAGISPLSSNALPPAIPRRRADSSGDRSIGELSTVSGVSGHNRVHRSSSDGYELIAGNSLSPTYGRGAPPKPLSRRSQSPKPPRRSQSPTPHNSNNVISGQPGHPLHQRRPSDEFYSNRHRRTHSFDVPRDQQIRRQNSTASLYSLNSQGSMNSETLRMLPDPRWGGGSGGGGNNTNNGGVGSGDRDRARSSSYSGNLGSYSTDSDPFAGGNKGYGGYYGSTNSSSKEVIVSDTNYGEYNKHELQPRQHRRNNSEVSTSTYASGVSIDKSVEPVLTNMSKSSMFKGVTNRGLVKMQLPKDNFRLLSDRDLESGAVYKRALVDNEDEYFQDYHITFDEEHPLAPTSECQCKCTNCQNCHVRRKQLPPSYYVMAVDSDIYRRMFDEVSESMSMPCGLFYCGHHEDVDYPNIGIAVLGVVTIFVVMLWATIYVEG